MRKILTFISLFLLLCISACSSKLMSPVQHDQIRQLDENTSRITFYRSSIIGSAVQAPIVEAINNDIKFCGIASSSTRFHYLVNPGEHTFVVGGENGSILKADIVPGKNYYVQVIPMLGLWKARFCLEPMSRKQLEDPEVKDEIQKCDLVQANSAAKSWFKENYSSMKDKFSKGIRKFNNTKEEKKSKFILSKDDCIDELY